MNFTLRFIRFAFGDGTTDDVVKIKMTEVDHYSLNYLYRNAGQEIRTEQTLSGNDVFRWARAALGLLRADCEPFAMIQMEMTGLPIVLFDFQEFSRNDRTYHTILDGLEFFLEVAQKQQGVEIPSTLSESSFAGVLNYQDFKKKPDTFKIQATPTEDQFVVTYKDSDAAAKQQLVLTRRQTEDWNKLALDCLSADADLFDSLQLCVTGFPDVLLRAGTVAPDLRVDHFLGAATVQRVMDALNFFLSTVERPEETFIPVPHAEAPALKVTRYFHSEEAEETEEPEEEDLETEEYSTDSEDEYADMPPLIPAHAACCSYHDQNQKANHLFFDSDGDVIMSY